jgi:hypothetical protein
MPIDEQVLGEASTAAHVGGTQELGLVHSQSILLESTSILTDLVSKIRIRSMGHMAHSSMRESSMATSRGAVTIRNLGCTTGKDLLVDNLQQVALQPRAIPSSLAALQWHGLSFEGSSVCFFPQPVTMLMGYYHETAHHA